VPVVFTKAPLGEVVPFSRTGWSLSTETNGHQSPKSMATFVRSAHADVLTDLGSLRGYLLALSDLGLEKQVMTSDAASAIGKIREDVDVLLFRLGLSRARPQESSS
jgi:hypothetical protein